MAAENENSNRMEASNETVVTGDNNGTITQGDDIDQHIRSGASRFPVRDPQNQNARVDRILTLLNILPLNPNQLGWLSGGLTGLGILGFMTSIMSIAPNPTGFSTWMSVVQIPYPGPAFVIGLTAAVAGAYVLDTLNASMCPECGRHLALRVTDADELLHGGDEVKRVERHLACETCSYETTRYEREEQETTA